MDVDQSTTEGYALGEAGSLDAAAKADVFDDLHAEGFEAADVEIGAAADEVEGANADGVVSGFGVGDAPGAGGPEAEELEEAEEGGLVPALDGGGGDGD